MLIDVSESELLTAWRRGDEPSFDVRRLGWDEGKAVVGHGVGVGNTVSRSVIF